MSVGSISEIKLYIVKMKVDFVIVCVCMDSTMYITESFDSKICLQRSCHNFDDFHFISILYFDSRTCSWLIFCTTTAIRSYNSVLYSQFHPFYFIIFRNRFGKGWHCNN